jgi:Mg-chelatase subunit ChlI
MYQYDCLDKIVLAPGAAFSGVQVFHFDGVRKDESFACPHRCRLVDAPADQDEVEEQVEDAESAQDGVVEEAVANDAPGSAAVAIASSADEEGVAESQRRFPAATPLKSGSNYPGVVRCYDDRAHALYVVYEDGDCGWGQPWRTSEFWFIRSD